MVCGKFCTTGNNTAKRCKSTPADSFIEEYESGKGVNNADKKIKWMQDSFPMQYYRRFDSG